MKQRNEVSQDLEQLRERIVVHQGLQDAIVALFEVGVRIPRVSRLGDHVKQGRLDLLAVDWLLLLLVGPERKDSRLFWAQLGDLLELLRKLDHFLR